MIAYMGDQTKNLDKTMWGIVLVAGAMLADYCALFGFISKSVTRLWVVQLVGFGLYIAGIAAIGVLVSAYLFSSPTDNIKDSFNSMKKNIENKMGNTGTTTHPPPP